MTENRNIRDCISSCTMQSTSGSLPGFSDFCNIFVRITLLVFEAGRELDSLVKAFRLPIE